MTYRHHLAELESHTENTADYRFTPDSIKKQHWGKVRFNLNDFSHKILVSAPDTSSTDSWQDSICTALAFKLKKTFSKQPLFIPEVLEFVV